MTAGLFLKNEAGGIQIDETYPSVGLIQSGNLTIQTINHSGWSSSFGYDEHGAIITVTGTRPILALGGDYFCGIKSTVDNGDGTWTFQVCAEVAANGHDVPYYVFDNATLVADEGCGLLVWNAAGELVFASSQKPMRLIDIKTGSLPSGWSNSANTYANSWVYETSRTYAFAPLSTGYRYRWVFPNPGQPVEQWFEAFYGAKRIAGGIQAQIAGLLALTASNKDSQAGDFETQNYGFLIFDVTNY